MSFYFSFPVSFGLFKNMKVNKEKILKHLTERQLDLVVKTLTSLAGVLGFNT